jgi:Ribonuclease G/E
VLLRDENIALKARIRQLRKAKSGGGRSVAFTQTISRARLRDAVRKAEEAAQLQAEVDRLKETREVESDGEAAQQIAAKRKEIEELTEQLDAAMTENKRLKQLMDA